MLDPAPIADDDILERLRSTFAIDAEAVRFLPLGFDADAWVYRVHAADGDRFLKIRRGPVHEAGLVVPRLLADRGIPHLVAPIQTTSGALFDDGDLAFVLFPYIDGSSGGEVGMSPAQWAELGATLRAIHDLPVDEALRSLLRRDDFEPVWVPSLRVLEGMLEGGRDPLDRELVALWGSYRSEIHALAERTLELARLGARSGAEVVLCHADIHAWNVLITPTGDFLIVDWDGAILAPRERDLLFVDGVAGGHAADPDAFFAGYGDVDVDPTLLAYYAADWAMQDLIGFSEQVLAADASDEARAEALEMASGVLTRVSP